MPLEIAAEWGLPPWQIEAEAPAVWVDRWVALRVARNEKAKRDSKRGGGRQAKGKRLV